MFLFFLPFPLFLASVGGALAADAQLRLGQIEKLFSSSMYIKEIFFAGNFSI